MDDRIADLFLRSAARHIVASKVLANSPGIDDTVIGFHAQQACEKCLKAALSLAGVAFRRTHDLALLTALLESEGCELPSFAQGLYVLNPYGFEGRYGLIEAGQLDREAALETIDSMYAWAKALVSRE